MDQKSFQILEFDKIREQLAEYTSFSAGATLARQLEPVTELEAARRRQAETREAVALRDRTDATIGGTRDVRRPVQNALRGFTVRPEEFLEIRGTLIAGRTLRRKLLKGEEHYPHLAAIANLIEECPGIVTAITDTLDDRGDVLDGASTRLANVRKSIRVAYDRIQDKLQNLLNSSMNQYLQEPIITTRGGRYVVPLKADYKGRIKGIVHDQSGSGATLWVEPMTTVDLNNEYRSLQLQEEEEIERILAELSAKIAQQAEAITRVVERMAELDMIFARADYAVALDAVAPEFVEWRTFPQPRPPRHANERENWQPPPRNPHPGSTLWIRGARHPLLDPHTVVPTDLLLDEDVFLVLITGPNTGGKTVSLKTTGLMLLMAQSGMHLPAVEAKLTVFDDIFADIGDEQSIEQSLSTFSAHITNITRILEQANERTLVLLDELGSGTDPAEGAALAQAIVDFLFDRGVTTFVATHFPELKVYASQTPGATNASLMFDVDTLSPTYEMTIGLPGRSNAVAIARRLGLDETILDEALALLGAGSDHAESLLDSIYDIREKISSQEAATRLALKEVEEERDALQARLETIEEERQQVLDDARQQVADEIEALRAEIRQLRKDIRSGRGDGDLSVSQLKKMGRRLSEMEEELEPEEAAPKPPSKKKIRRMRETLEVGDTVMVKSLGTKGEILSVDAKEAEVAVGRLHTRASLADLELVEAVEDKRETEQEPAISVNAESPGMQLDLRGQRVHEGLSSLESYLDSAILAGLPWVRIIHGKGTGRMREAVRDSLRQNTRIHAWEEAKASEGGAGVTVVKLAPD